MHQLLHSNPRHPRFHRCQRGFPTELNRPVLDGQHSTLQGSRRSPSSILPAGTWSLICCANVEISAASFPPPRSTLTTTLQASRGAALRPELRQHDTEHRTKTSFLKNTSPDAYQLHGHAEKESRSLTLERTEEVRRPA